MITNNPDKQEVLPRPQPWDSGIWFRSAVSSLWYDARSREAAGDVDAIRLDNVTYTRSRASVAAVEGDGLADVVQSYINEIRERFRGVSDGTWKSTAIAIVDELEQKLITHQVDQYAPAAASSPAPAEVPQGDDPSHKHYNIPIAMSGDSAEVYYGLESECPICKRQNDDINPAPAEPPSDDHRCPHCGRRMQSDFDEDVGMWYECANCDYRESVSSRQLLQPEGEQEKL